MFAMVMFLHLPLSHSVHRGMPGRGGESGPGGLPGLRGAWSGEGPGSWSGGLVGGVCVETPRRLLLRVVRILLECILVKL